MKIELDIQKKGKEISIWLSDNIGGSGIEVQGTLETVVDNLKPYLEEYVFRMNHNKQ